MKIAEGSGVTVTGTYPNFSIKTAKPVATALTLPVTNFTPTTASPTLTLNSNHHVIFANTSSSRARFILPDPRTVKGKRYTFIKTSTSNELFFTNYSIKVSAGSTVNSGIYELKFSGTNEKLTIVSDGALWWKLEN